MTSSPNITVSIQGEAVQETSAYKFLSVWFDTHLTFRKHCVEVASTRVLQALAGSNWGAQTNTLLLFFRTFVEPVCLYGIATWGTATKDSNLNRVEVVRNEGLRTASGLPRSTKLTTLRTLTGTLPLRTLGEARSEVI